jgi:hypothetical protein
MNFNMNMNMNMTMNMNMNMNMTMNTNMNMNINFKMFGMFGSLKFLKEKKISDKGTLVATTKIIISYFARIFNQPQ